MQEAMSQGLPLIITPNTGGSDLIVEGETGFLVQIRRPDLIAEKIAWFADHREALPEMAKASQRKAAQYTWEAYGAAVARARPVPFEPVRWRGRKSEARGQKGSDSGISPLKPITDLTIVRDHDQRSRSLVVLCPR
jgi:hypothetical protein